MKISKIHRKGNYHISRRRLCDDAYYELQLNENVYLISVADGCSSSRFGAVAADAITKEIGQCFQEANLSDFVDSKDDSWVGITTCQLISECFIDDNSDKLKRLIKNIVDRVVDRYINLIGVPFFEFSTTLTVCLVDTQENQIVCVSIGDGFAGVIHKSHFTELATPQNINGDSRRTYFVTDPDAVNNMTVCFFNGDFNRLILTTDGLSKLYDEQQYSDLFDALCVSGDYELYQELIEPYEGGMEYYSSLGDDITLLICEWSESDINTDRKEIRKDCSTEEEAPCEIPERNQKDSQRKPKRPKHRFIRCFVRWIKRIIRLRSISYKKSYRKSPGHSSR